VAPQLAGLPNGKWLPGAEKEAAANDVQQEGPHPIADGARAYR
jgi:hypothetical protein